MNFRQNISYIKAIQNGKNSFGQFQFDLDVSKLSQDDRDTLIDQFRKNAYCHPTDTVIDVYFDNVFLNKDGFIDKEDVLKELSRLTKIRKDNELIEEGKRQQAENEIKFLQKQQAILNKPWWRFWTHD